MKSKSELNQTPSRFYEPSFQLTPSEIKFPALVIDSFCERHTIESLRMHLKEWLSSTQEGKLPFFITLSRELEKMIEATFIMNKNEVSGLIDKEGNTIDSMEYHLNSTTKCDIVI